MARPKSPIMPSVPTSVSPAQAIQKVQRQLDRLEALIQMRHDDPEVDAWESTTETVLNAAFGRPNGDYHPTSRDILRASGGPMWVNMTDDELQEYHENKQRKRKALLVAAMEQLKDQAEADGIAIEESSPERALEQVIHILDRFHAVVVQLRHRHDDRETLDVGDEYDVQDLLLALLKIDFDDVRREEHAPSTAGTNPRMDILLKREQIVIEVKKTRAGLGDKQLGEELIQDIASYQSHPDCKILVCFIYDPEHRVRNPGGLQADLARVGAPKLKVVTIVTPRQ